MNVLLTGATGYIGRRLLEKLLGDESVRLRLFVRNSRKVQADLEDRVEPFEGNTEEPPGNGRNPELEARPDPVRLAPGRSHYRLGKRQLRNHLPPGSEAPGEDHAEMGPDANTTRRCLGRAGISLPGQGCPGRGERHRRHRSRENELQRHAPSVGRRHGAEKNNHSRPASQSPSLFLLAQTDDACSFSYRQSPHPRVEIGNNDPK